MGILFHLLHFPGNLDSSLHTLMLLSPVSVQLFIFIVPVLLPFLELLELSFTSGSFPFGLNQHSLFTSSCTQILIIGSLLSKLGFYIDITFKRLFQRFSFFTTFHVHGQLFRKECPATIWTRLENIVIPVCVGLLVISIDCHSHSLLMGTWNLTSFFHRSYRLSTSTLFQVIIHIKHPMILNRLLSLSH